MHPEARDTHAVIALARAAAFSIIKARE